LANSAIWIINSSMKSPGPKKSKSVPRPLATKEPVTKECDNQDDVTEDFLKKNKNTTPASAIRAVLAQDLTALEEAVGKGHGNIKLELVSGLIVADRSLALLSIDKDWPEGLSVLLSSSPPFGAETLEDWKDQALRQGSAKVLNWFLEKFPDPQSGDRWFDLGHLERALINGMGRPSGYEAPGGVIGVERVLRLHGWETQDITPGPFEDGDSSPAGHNLWTAALARNKWKVAAAVWPRIRLPPSYPSAVPLELEFEEEAFCGQKVPIRYIEPAEVAAWPRLIEALQNLRVAVQFGDREAYSLLARWWSQLAPFIKLPFPECATSPADWIVMEALSADERARIWAIWEAAKDPEGVTPLHVWALQSRRPEALILANLAKIDKPSAFLKWDVQSNGGVSPAQLWDECGNAPWRPEWIKPQKPSSQKPAQERHKRSAKSEKQE
jgi:hypothetical protein